VAIAFHPGGVPGTKVADNAPEWLRKTFKDTRKSSFAQFSFPVELFLIITFVTLAQLTTCF
jgi:hypothetical protein